MSPDDIGSEQIDERMWSGREGEEARSEPNAEPAPQPVFGKVRRGYDPDEVSRYVESSTARFRVLEDRAAELEKDLDRARGQLEDLSNRDPYDAISVRMADVMRSFDQQVEGKRGEAGAEVGRILDEARSDADRIRLDAQTNAEQVRAEAERSAEKARAEADAHVSGLESQRSSLLSEIRALKARMLEAARTMTSPSDDEATDEVVIADDVVEVSDPAGGSKEVRPGPSGSRGRPR